MGLATQEEVRDLKRTVAALERAVARLESGRGSAEAGGTRHWAPTRGGGLRNPGSGAPALDYLASPRA